jgi:hypothetical protein
MARSHFDGVIEAVRYAPNGDISMVRAYQWRGAVWSDIILLERQALIEQLEKGKRYVTGTRKEYFGGVFKTGLPVHWSDNHVITEGKSAQRDLLAGVAVF